MRTCAYTCTEYCEADDLAIFHLGCRPAVCQKWFVVCFVKALRALFWWSWFLLATNLGTILEVLDALGQPFGHFGRQGRFRTSIFHTAFPLLAPFGSPHGTQEHTDDRQVVQNENKSIPRSSPKWSQSVHFTHRVKH